MFERNFLRTFRAVTFGVSGFLIIITLQIRHDVAQTRRDVERQSGPVCYSQTEDSELTGCDYSGGVWRPKH